jgi:hypothetical protein
MECNPGAIKYTAAISLPYSPAFSPYFYYNPTKYGSS